MANEPQSIWRDGLFDPKSASCHEALEDLAVALDQLGFKVRKKPPQEATLRVYVAGHNTYPLLNPRLEANTTYRRQRRVDGFLVFNVLSKGDLALDDRLRSFNSDSGTEFVAADDDSGGYHHHGQFVIPLHGAGTPDGSIAFAALRESFLEIARICEAPRTSGSKS